MEPSILGYEYLYVDGSDMKSSKNITDELSLELLVDENAFIDGKGFLLFGVQELECSSFNFALCNFSLSHDGNNNNFQIKFHNDLTHPQTTICIRRFVVVSIDDHGSRGFPMDVEI